MRIESKPVPIFETKSIQTGERTEITYIAFDGKTFSSEGKCLDYENKLNDIATGSHLVKELKFNQDIQDVLMLNIFHAFEFSLVNIFEIRGTKNKNDVMLIDKYLYAKIGNHLPYDFKDVPPTETAFVAFWCEYEASDYPNNKSSVVTRKDIVKYFKHLITNINTTFNL